MIKYNPTHFAEGKADPTLVKHEFSCGTVGGLRAFAFANKEDLEIFERDYLNG